MSKKYENINDFDENKEPEKKKRFTLNPFENVFRKDGKGVSRDGIKVLDKPNLGNFFKLLRRKLNQVFSVNLLLIFGNFPLFFALLAVAYTTRDVLAPSSQIYPLLQGTAYFDNTPLITELLGVFGKQDSISAFSTMSYVLFGLSGLTLVTFGPVNVGSTYILRNVIRAEPVFVWSDFWYAIRRNIKQALIFGVIDIAMIAMLGYDIVAYRINVGNAGIYTFMYVLSYGMAILYFFIRMYVYPMIVTFDMSLFKIIKNSVFFSVLGIKRNVMVLLGTLVLVIGDYYLINIFLPIGIILPFIILFGLVEFMSVYAAFPKIKEIMIDPYYREVENKKEVNENA